MENGTSSDGYPRSNRKWLAVPLFSSRSGLRRGFSFLGGLVGSNVLFPEDPGTIYLLVYFPLGPRSADFE